MREREGRSVGIALRGSLSGEEEHQLPSTRIDRRMRGREIWWRVGRSTMERHTDIEL